jgi:hypothetical protein
LQTLSYIEARLGNFNSLIMMRVRETATAELLIQ